MGISGHVNKSNLTEIKETGCQHYIGSGERWSKGIKRERSESELLENQECVSFQVEWNQNRERKGDGSRGCAAARTQRESAGTLSVPSNSLLFLPLSCLNNFRISDQRQKSSILELAHAELL